MWPGPFVPSLDLIGTMMTKNYCLVATARWLTGQQVPSAPHVPWHRPGIRTGERAHQRLGGCPEHTRMVQHQGLAQHPGNPPGLAFTARDRAGHHYPRTNQLKKRLPEKCETNKMS